MRRFLAGILIGPLLLAAVALIGWRDAQNVLDAPLPLSAPLRYEIVSGASVQGVIDDLRARGIILDRRLGLYLRILARARNLPIKAGEYAIAPGTSARELLDMFMQGRTLLHELRIVEGWTFAQALTVVAAEPALVHNAAGKTPEALMAELGFAGEPAEGHLFPDTYLFPKGMSELAFLRRAATTAHAVLQKEWDTRDADLPYNNPQDALTMASIIEKETGVEAERAMVAAVFVNRLRLGMKLQTDPTVIYGRGAAFDGNLHRSDLELDTPYNTYTRAGLPPTPICLPGRKSLQAALHPAASKALYFVSRGDGTHQYSETLEEHNAAVQKFQLTPHAKK